MLGLTEYEEGKGLKSYGLFDRATNKRYGSKLVFVWNSISKIRKLLRDTIYTNTFYVKAESNDKGAYLEMYHLQPLLDKKQFYILDFYHHNRIEFNFRNEVKTFSNVEKLIDYLLSEVFEVREV